MSKRIVRLTESDLNKLIRKVIKESEEEMEILPDSEDAEVGVTNDAVESQTNQPAEPIAFDNALRKTGQDPTKLSKEKEYAEGQLATIKQDLQTYCTQHGRKGALKFIKEKIKGLKRQRRENRKNRQTQPIQESLAIIFGVVIGLVLLGSFIFQRRTKKYGCPDTWGKGGY